MRLLFKFGMMLAMLCSTSNVALAVARKAAGAVPAYENSAITSLLSAEQGAMLVDFALKAGAKLHTKPDCSHLVHIIYSRAGLNYGYQPSRALYAGVEDFERVTRPQKGDLIVWRGHVGIVVSPRQKTFFSSVRSGIITESWVEHQWRVRGRPHFLRYRIGPDSNPELLASLAHGDSETVVQDGEDGATDMSADAASTRPVSGADDDDSDLPQTEPKEPVQPAGIVAVVQKRNKPNKKEIAAALVEGSNKLAVASLAADSTITPDRPISVVARVEVEKIKVHGAEGTVMLRLSESMAIEQSRVLPAKTVEREFRLTRNTDAAGAATWLIVDPQQRTYIPQAQALGVFQHQAEIMLHRSPNSAATRTLVKALDLLYDQRFDSPQRAALK